MSTARTVIEEYLISTASKKHPLTEVRFGEAKIGDMDLVIISKDRRLLDNQVVSEEEIEQQLANEGLIRVPPVHQQPIGEFKRVDVGGKPMSEMIIEERR